MSVLLRIEGAGGGSVEATSYADHFALFRPEPVGQIDMPTFGRAILDAGLPFVEEVIATEAEVCIKFNEQFEPDSLAALERITLPDSCDMEDRAPLSLPVWLPDNFPDWGRIETHTGLTREEYLEQLLTCRFRVAMIGFLPGFVYLSGLTESLHVPRKATPDRQTSPGALAVGGNYLGVYSLPSPAGWNVVGSLAVRLMQIDRLPPVQLRPGDTLTLDRISEAEYQRIRERDLTLWEHHGIAESP